MRPMRAGLTTLRSIFGGLGTRLSPCSLTAGLAAEAHPRRQGESSGRFLRPHLRLLSEPGRGCHLRRREGAGRSGERSAVGGPGGNPAEATSRFWEEKGLVRRLGKFPGYRGSALDEFTLTGNERRGTRARSGEQTRSVKPGDCFQKLLWKTVLGGCDVNWWSDNCLLPHWCSK